MKFHTTFLYFAALATAHAAPTLYHRFDNDPGAADGIVPTSITDGTANANVSTLIAGMPVYSAEIFAPTLPKGGPSNTLSLDLERSRAGYYQVADAPSLDLNAGGAITIEAWVKLESLGFFSGTDNGPSRQILALKKSGAAPDTMLNYGFLLNTANTYTGAVSNPIGAPDASGRSLTFLVGNGTTYTAVHSTLLVNDTDWHFVAVRFDDTTDTVRFTVDGQSQDVTGVTQTVAGNSLDLLVGAHTNGSGAFDFTFDGRIDELRISDTFLSDADLLGPVPQAADIRITGFTVTPPDSLTLSFTSMPGTDYRIEAGTMLDDFTGVGVISATGSSTDYIRNGVTLGPREFFRVVEVGTTP